MYVWELQYSSITYFFIRFKCYFEEWNIFNRIQWSFSFYSQMNNQSISFNVNVVYFGSFLTQHIRGSKLYLIHDSGQFAHLFNWIKLCDQWNQIDMFCVAHMRLAFSSLMILPMSKSVFLPETETIFSTTNTNFGRSHYVLFIHQNNELTRVRRQGKVDKSIQRVYAFPKVANRLIIDSYGRKIHYFWRWLNKNL